MFVIFDYDGVIFNSGPAIHHAGLEFYAHLGLPTPSIEETKRWLGPTIRESVLRTCAEHDIANPDIHALSELYFKAANAARRAMARAFDGSVELIKDLKAAGIPVGIATMKAQTEIAELKDVLPALDLVDVFRSPDDHHGGKTKKQLVGEVIAHLGLPTAQMTYDD